MDILSRSRDRAEVLLRNKVIRTGLRCLFCGSDNSGLVQEAACSYGETKIDIWHCFECGIRFSDWDKTKLIDYAQISERHAWYQVRNPNAQYVANLLSIGTEPYWAYLAAQHINRSITDLRYREFLYRISDAAKVGRVLNIFELGFGAGTIAGIGAHLGHRYSGAEIDSHAVSKAADLFSKFGAELYQIENDWLSQPASEKYDFVFCSDVIEHVSEPKKLLNKLVSMVSPGGVLILTTPDLDLNSFHIWRTAPPPLHTCFLNRRAIQRAVHAAAPGAHIDFINEKFGPQYEQENPPDIIMMNHHQMDPTRPDFSFDIKNLGIGFIPTRRFNESESGRGESLVAVITVPA